MLLCLSNVFSVVCGFLIRPRVKQLKVNRRKSGPKDEETFKTLWGVNFCFKLADPVYIT